MKFQILYYKLKNIVFFALLQNIFAMEKQIVIQIEII